MQTRIDLLRREEYSDFDNVLREIGDLLVTSFSDAFRYSFMEGGEAYCPGRGPKGFDDFCAESFSFDSLKKLYEDPASIFVKCETVEDREARIVGVAVMKRESMVELEQQSITYEEYNEAPCFVKDVVHAKEYLQGDSRSIIELKRLYVLPRFHGKGLGTRLLSKCCEIVQGMEETVDERGVFFYLGVWSKNPGAIRLYAKHGFKYVGYHNFSVDGHDFVDYILGQVAVNTNSQPTRSAAVNFP
eukprot:Nk52_evm38s554 gene=Nk52_evmTU38s554